MSATKLLSAAEILAAPDVQMERVEVPEWGGSLYVREFSAGQREQFDDLLTAGADGEDEGEVKADTRNVRCRVVALTACDDKGQLLFTVEQATALATKSNAAISRVWDVAARLNRLRAKDRDDEKKESATPQSAGSPTA
ncbi:MAG TPA: hypothetical protein VGE74_12845 [Gemmata sp.]